MSMTKLPSTRKRWLMPRRPHTPDCASAARGTRRRTMESWSVRVITNAGSNRMRIGREGIAPLARSRHELLSLALALVRGGVPLRICRVFADLADGGVELLFVEAVIGEDLVGVIRLFLDLR